MDEILYQPNSPVRRRPNAAPDLPESAVHWKERWEEGAEALRQAIKNLRLKLDEATAGGRRLVNPVHFFAVAAVVGVAAVVSTVYTPSYAVTMDGVPLGVVRNPQVFEEVVDRVEARAESILGRGYVLEGEPAFDFALSERGELTDVREIEEYLFHQIDEIMSSYVLKVDGQFIGAALEESSLEELLKEVKAPYVTENTVSSDFTSRVTVFQEYTPTDVNLDLEAMFAQLTENTNGQTTYEVVKGDTFMQIALDNGT